MRSILGALLMVALAAPAPLWAGVGCQVEFTYNNAHRHVYGETATECGGFPIPHSPPWSNWGTETMFTSRVDGEQFMGWKASEGNQWNSCSAVYPWNQHTSQWFNYDNNTEQFSQDERNYSYYISDVIEDLMCSEIGIYTVNNWWMEVWDLDKFSSDYHFRTAEWDEINVNVSSCGGYNGEECSGDSGLISASSVSAEWPSYNDLLWVHTKLKIETWLGSN
jgi:hypothetical protein